LIEKLKQYDIGLARYYERELNSILYYKQKYANRGEKRESRVRIRYASAKITEYFNANESESESDKRELVNDGNAVDAVDVSKILRPKPRSVKTDVKSNTKTTVKRKPGLLRLMNAIGKDFVNMYYYRGRY
jgi:hypothetical protein